MPFQISPLVTLGMGTGNAIVLIGFGPISKVTKVIRGGRRRVEKLFNESIDNFKIQVMLLEVNGKELVKPIFRSNNFVLEDKETEVKIKNIKVQKKNRRIFSVITELFKVKRGRDGND